MYDKQKQKERRDRYIKKNPGRVMVLHRQKKFGMSDEDYCALLLQQNNRCALCGNTEDVTQKGKIKALAVDHDHESGGVRGLLCHRCNTALGGFRESLELLQKAIDYLKLHK